LYKQTQVMQLWALYSNNSSGQIVDMQTSGGAWRTTMSCVDLWVMHCMAQVEQKARAARGCHIYLL